MRIKSYETKRFAGLRDMEIEFDQGLNVILGPNESGKSTIIDGIHSTLFKNIKLRKNNNLDKDFTFKYMPKPSGDFIDGKVIMEIEEEEYEIYKEWGSKETIHLIKNDGSILKNEKDIDSQMLNLLGYGESTYSNIVFAKQRDLKIALTNIINNSQVTDEVNDLLRKTMMELEGVSIDKIQKDIEDEIERLYKRWDKSKGYPENNRGPNNPYKTGLGAILGSYYKKEELLSLMEETKKSEEEFEDICKRIKVLEDAIEPLKEEKTLLEDIEDDVNKRSLLEVKVEALKNEMEDLLDANKNWPRVEQMLEQYDEKLDFLKEEKEKLNGDKNNIEKEKQRAELENKLEKLKIIDEKRQDIVEQLSKIGAIDSVDIDKLREEQAEILRLDTTMRASKMIGILNKKTEKKVYVRRDFEEREILEKDIPFEANGVISIIYEDNFEVEIKTGDIDFEDLSDRYNESKKAFEKLLKKLKLENIEEGKLKIQRIKELEDDKKSLESERRYILEDTNKEELEAKIEELSAIRIFRSLDEIEELIEKNDDQRLEISSKKINESEKVEKWKEKYTDHDELLDLVIGKKTSLKEEEASLSALKPLPQEFQTAEEFKVSLKSIKESLSEKEMELESLRPLFYQAKSNIRDLSFEEANKEYIEAEKKFKSKLKRGEKFLEIQRVFLETKEELSNNPMETLVNEFARLLETITDGDYKKSHIDEDFNIKLENTLGQIPIELLSAGTYDSVTLALRFSLLKHIFHEREGYVVLDDCLVDLDPKRKLQSVKMINDFAEDYQIIFTTCDPETAKMLGGNIIEI